MKLRTLASAALLGGLCGCQRCEWRETAALPEAVFDRGGTVFDLEAISRERFPMKEGGFTGKAARLKESDPFAPVVVGVDWAKVRRETPGGARGVAFHYRFHNVRPGSGTGKVHLVIRGMHTNPDGTRTVSQEDWPTKIRETGDGWATYFLWDVGLTSKSDWLELIFDPKDGLGTFEIKDGQGVPFQKDDSHDPAKYKVAMRLMGIDGFDGVHTLATGMDQQLVVYWKLNDRKTRLRADGLSLKIDLPPGVRALNGWEKMPSELMPQYQERGYSAPFFHLTTDLKPGTKVGDGTITAFYEGKPCSKPLAVKFAVEEPAVAKCVPKRYFNGTCMTRPAMSHSSDENVERWTKMAYAAGWRAAHGGGSRCVLDVAAKLGPMTFNSCGVYFLANGFSIGTHPSTWDKCPKDQVFIGRDKKTGELRPEPGAICPLAVSERKSYFTEKVIPCLEEHVKNYSCFMENWEPNMYFGRGCFCANCRAAFAKWVKRDEADVAKNWPDCARPGGRFAAEAIAFRARQHGALVKTIDATIRKIQGAKSHGFCPEIAWTTVSGDMLEDPLSGEVAGEEYAGSLEWINAWGPYVWWDAYRPYVPEKRLPVAGWVSAKTVRENVDRRYGPKPPKLIAFPHGRQGSHWEGTPDWLGMNLDAYFFNRWEGSLVYYFPRGYDVRWWRKFAEATTRAGWYEDYVLDGTRNDAATKLETVPEYAAPCHQVSAYLKKARNVSPLCTATYDLKGARIVAALNYWEKGEAFFTLKTSGLAKGKYTVLVDRETLLVKADGSALWTAEELAAGEAFVGVGKARTKVFEIQPVQAHAEQKAVNRQSVTTLKALYRSLLPDLRREAARDHEEEAGRTNLCPDGTPII